MKILKHFDPSKNPAKPLQKIFACKFLRKTHLTIELIILEIFDFLRKKKNDNNHSLMPDTENNIKNKSFECQNNRKYQNRD